MKPDWWSKTFAGAFLGGTLALALAGLFAWIGPGGIDAPEKAQFVMWMMAPMWMAVFSTVYLFRTGLRAILCLGGANLAAYGLLFYVRG